VLVAVVVPYWESHPFVWRPLAGQRHAIDRKDRTVPLGESIQCLCGERHPRGPEGEVEWLWPTCKRCWDLTCEIVGLRPRRVNPTRRRV
jgi:hypothetical protein